LEIPQLIKIRQHFNQPQIADIESTVTEELNRSGVTLRKGTQVAIAVGSRGVANISLVVKATVAWVKSKGGEAFIVPAMGSHGGATAPGQKELLASYGVTEDFIGAPIRSSLQVVELPQGDLKNHVYMDKYAYEADATIIINRVKVHTDFHGPHESGLMKMCVIGLGKHKQALEIHRYNINGLKHLIVPTALQVLKHGNIILGIALVENALDQTAIIKALKPAEIEAEEIKLLERCREMMPKLPVDQLDILFIDEFGKNISGSGMDTNIIGRLKIRGEEEPKRPDITNIIVAGITEASHGNACGIGLADITIKKVFDQIDFAATYQNIVTSTFLERGKIPIVADNNRTAMEYALRTCGPIEPEDARIIRIKNTLRLQEMYVSRPVLNEIQSNQNIEITNEFVDLLDDMGELKIF
jgi:hypothetical protein